MSEEQEQLFYEMKQYLVQYSQKWNTLCDIEQLIIDKDKEIERLNNELEKQNIDYGLEIERLNNIINELEKELELNLKFKVIGVKRLKNKLQELKGDSNNDK